MKKAEEYLEKITSLTTREDLYAIGKQMQEDAIEATLRMAAEEADKYCGIIHPTSILSLKDKLFKQLEDDRKKDTN